MPRLLALAAALAVTAGAALAHAEVLRAEPSSEQLGLELRVDETGLSARVRRANEPWEQTPAVKLNPPESVTKELASARARVLELEGKRRAIRVDVPHGAATWTLLLAAPLARGEGAPLVLWTGWLGARGEQPEERRENVLLEEPGDGGTRLVVGERRADVTLCGRPTLLAARTLDPAAMTLSRALVRDELGAARAAAPRLFAKRESEAPITPRLLRAIGASSAQDRAVAPLTDGDPETAWSESRSGAGEGELVVMSASSDVPLLGLDVVIRPPTREVPGGAAPRTLLVATREQLFHVTLPEDAWQQPGARYVVRFPEPTRSDCYAVALEQAYADPRRGEPRVSLAEVSAHTELDGLAPEALAGALAGGDGRAVAASEVLARLGEPGARAAAGLFERLDPAGRQLASRVVEAADCAVEAPFQAGRLAATAPRARDEAARAELEHARDRLRRCGAHAAAELRPLLAAAEPSVRQAAADDLVLVAPEQAVAALADGLATADLPTRRVFRAAFTRAVRRERGLAALEALLEPASFAARPLIARRDVLRAAVPVLARARGAADALSALSSGSDWAMHYLLLGAHAELARAGDARSLEVVKSALRGAEPRLRARAAEAAAGLDGVTPELVGALGDPEPRVRAASARALATASPRPGVAEALAARLAADPWTFVRLDTAAALAQGPASLAADRALAAALGDGSVEVRLRALDGLGTHRAVAQADVVRRLAQDGKAPLSVAERALETQAALCDARDVERWTELARAAASPRSDRDQRLGLAAIRALGRLGPKDLSSRLSPLLAEVNAREVRAAAAAALAAEPSCGNAKSR